MLVPLGHWGPTSCISVCIAAPRPAIRSFLPSGERGREGVAEACQVLGSDTL
jgi:hypothetical protein